VAARILRVDSATDEYQLVHALVRNRKQRARQGRFVVEGVRPISAAFEHGWPIDALWYPSGRPLSRWATSLLESGRAAAHVETLPELLAELGEKVEPSELLAVVRPRADDLARIPRRPDALIVAVDRPVSPGNLGSIIRSSDALGAHGLVVTGHAADVYDPQAIRASTGSIFALPVVREGSMAAIGSWLAALRSEIAGLQVVGSSARATTPVTDVDLTRPTVLALGNETRGLSQSWREACDELVVIPMVGKADSLNAAAAGSILLYEASRQRRVAAAGA
jgi:23S rRNA (uridine2479-2'-O)-methyltransferase